MSHSLVGNLGPAPISDRAQWRAVETSTQREARWGVDTANWAGADTSAEPGVAMQAAGAAVSYHQPVMLRDDRRCQQRRHTSPTLAGTVQLAGILWLFDDNPRQSSACKPAASCIRREAACTGTCPGHPTAVQLQHLGMLTSAVQANGSGSSPVPMTAAELRVRKGAHCAARACSKQDRQLRRPTILAQHAAVGMWCIM